MTEAVQPTFTNRIHALDVLRGFAVLGILLANIPAFAGPELTQQFTPQTEKGSVIDQWVEAFTLVFVTGKFRTTLAILFGAGLYLQFAKRSPLEGQWPERYLKRMLLLSLLGFLHGTLIWYGDILYLYGFAGFVTALLVRANETVLKCLFGVAAGLALLGGLVGLLALLIPEGSSGSSPMGAFLPTPAMEKLIFGSGSWVDQLTIRAPYFGVFSFLQFLLLPFIVGLFLLGFLLAKNGVFAAPSAHSHTRNWMLILGLGFGLPLNLLAFFALPAQRLESLSLTWELFVGPLLGIGYLMLLAIAVEKGWMRPVTNLLAKVGRVALSVYLLQSLLCTFVFYSWGLGLFGRLDRLTQLGVVLAVWTVCILFAHLWLRRFSIGPVEWLWRSVSEGRRMPWKSPPEESAAATVTV